MTLTVQIVAKTEPRLLTRILQVFESQRVGILAFHAEIEQGIVRITATVISEGDRAYRIGTLLDRLEDVQTVSVKQIESWPSQKHPEVTSARA